MDKAEIEDLVVDDRTHGIFRVNRRVFTDPRILEQERREVFDRSWLYAGHESEIAKPGDFVTRKVGGRPLILVRDESGTPHAFLNTCPHRGNTVCRERAGSTRLLRCFYHAWAFELTGKLAGVPGEDAYTPAFDRDALGLQPVSRLETYRGMMFVSFDPVIESLVAYLGNAREYLDLMLDFGGEEVEIVHGSGAGLHGDRRLGQSAEGRVAAIAAAALRELHLVPGTRRVRHAGRRLCPRRLPARLCGVARIVVVGHVARHGVRPAFEPG
jgi:p-cumate 2,3-dioxygenase alpha subunit